MPDICRGRCMLDLMDRLFVVVVSALAFGLVAPTVAGQDATPRVNPAAQSCIAPSSSFATPPSSFGTPFAAEAIAAEPESDDEAPLPPRTPHPGVPASGAVLEQIRAAEETLAACFAADDYLAFTSLFTPRVLRDEFGVTSPGETPAHSVRYVLLREEIVTVSEAQTHTDGRVSADVVFGFAGERMRARDVFVETGGRLLLDEVIELPLAAAPAATQGPVDEVTLQNLAVLGFAPGDVPGIVSVATLGATIGMQPGSAVALVLGQFDYEVCGTGHRCFVPAPVRATWSVAPANGARIDPATGLLTIDPATPSGSVFTVRAAVEGGRHVVETEVHVSTPEANPLVGYWQEEAQLSCGSGTEVTPALPITELVFASDGTFAVTWTPFESYVDYWGTYTVDVARGTLELVVSGGNDIPPDVDGHGRFALDATGRLILSELWLGTTPRMGSDPAHCGHRFVR